MLNWHLPEDCSTFQGLSWFPHGLENLEKWENIFQSGNFEQSAKVRKFYPKKLEKLVVKIK